MGEDSYVVIRSGKVWLELYKTLTSHTWLKSPDLSAFAVAIEEAATAGKF